MAEWKGRYNQAALQLTPVIVPRSMEQKVKTEFHTLRVNLFVLAQTNKTDAVNVSDKQTIMRERQFPLCLLFWLRADDKLGPGKNIFNMFGALIMRLTVSSFKQPC